MNAKQFSVVLGEVDDRFITEALMDQSNTKHKEHKKHNLFKKLDSTAKRIAAIAASIILLFTLAMSVRAIREPFFEMVRTIFDKYDELTFEGDGKTYIQEIYGVTAIPEDYTMTLEIINSAAVARDYQNSEGNRILFSQSAGDGTMVNVDNEHTISQTMEVGEKEVYVVRFIHKDAGQDSVVAFWVENGYSFDLSFYGEITLEELAELIQSVQITETASITTKVNINGDTYGFFVPATTPDKQEVPNLVAAIGIDGTIGYVYESDLQEEMPRTPEEAVTYMQELEDARKIAAEKGEKYLRYIPLYDETGTTIIGQFGIEPISNAND